MRWSIGFRCGDDADDACQCGQLRDGSLWVAARDAQGVSHPITLTGLFAARGEVGAEFNPIAAQGGQAVCVLCDESYRPSFDTAAGLPFRIPGEGSLFAGASVSYEEAAACHPKKSHSGCLETTAVFTFFDRPPDDAVPGATLWRPPFSGNAEAGRAAPAERVKLYERDLRHSDDVLPRMDWTRLNPSKSTPWESDWRAIAMRWAQPLYQSCASQRGDPNCRSADAYRNFIPASVWKGTSSYAANRAAILSDDLMDLEGHGRAALNPAKAAAIDALVQQGLDVYGQARAGVAFRAGAGQGVGNLMPLALFAAHLGDTPSAKAVRRAMRAIPPRVFAEEWQISRGSEAHPTWGDGFGDRDRGVFGGSCAALAYWNGHFRGQCYRGADGECSARAPRSGSHSCGDPYGFVDGTSLDPGASYYSCCSAPIILHTWWHALLIPGMRDVFMNDRLENFFDNYLARGRKIDGQWHASPRLRPDPCAPPPPAGACARSDDVTSCPGWRSTFGPSQADPRRCIPHGGDPDTEGRFGHRERGYPGPPFSKMRPMNLFAEEGDATGLIRALRRCQHPGQAHLRGLTVCRQAATTGANR